MASMIFVVESVAILYILYSGVFNMRGSLLAISVIIVLAEIIVFVANDIRCPLTKLARRLGDKTGNNFVADLFLPECVARLISFVCGRLALIDLLIVGARLLIGQDAFLTNPVLFSKNTYQKSDAIQPLQYTQKDSAMSFAMSFL